MKLLRTLAGYTLYDHKTNNTIRQELRVTSILDRIDEYRKNWLLHLKRMPQNRIPLKLYNYRPQEEDQLEDQRNVGENSCNPWRRNGSKDPILDVYDDDEIHNLLLHTYRSKIIFVRQSKTEILNIAVSGAVQCAPTRN